jgi:hypothetical protein
MTSTARATLCVIAALLLVACGDQAEPSSDPTAQAPQEVTGVIVDIDSAGLGEVRSFELKSGDETFEILIDPQVDYGFNLGHLNEHLAGGQPVRVQIEERDGKLFARRIDDA